MDNEQMYGQTYDAPEDKSGIMDTKTGAILDKEELSPFELIKAVAKETGLELQDPNKNCKKCFGRGYVGIDSISRQPMPCECIQPKRVEGEKGQERQPAQPKMNRQQRRHMEKMQKRFVKKIMKQRKNMPVEEVEETETEGTEK
jgi:hypothetical protein